MESRGGGLSAVCGVSNSNDPGDSDLRGGAGELAPDLRPPEGAREILRRDCFCGSIATSRRHERLSGESDAAYRINATALGYSGTGQWFAWQTGRQMVFFIP